MRDRELVLLGLLAGIGAFYAWSRTSSGQAFVSSVSTTIGDFLTPRGIRNNNPGNIIRGPTQWQGQLTEAQVAAAGMTWDPTFVQFDTPANGVRAIGHILTSYANQGKTSVQDIITTYSATDQSAYVANVSASLGVQPTDSIDVYDSLPTLAAAIIQQENGEQPYSASDISNWVYS